MKRHKLSVISALALGALTAPTLALAQAYPNKPVNVIVVFAAGGPSDTIARLLSDHLGRQFGQQLVVENVAGAGGTIGTDRVAKAAPDGYTILTHHSGLTAAPAATRRVEGSDAASSPSPQHTPAPTDRHPATPSSSFARSAARRRA